MIRLLRPILSRAYVVGLAVAWLVLVVGAVVVVEMFG